MANKPERTMTWIEVAVRNAGLRKAMSGLTWAYCWAIAREAYGHDPSVEEVADWWKDSHRTAYREQAAFRASFPNLESPAGLFEQPEAQDRIREAVRRIGNLDAALPHRKSRADLAVVQLGLLTAHS